MVGTVDLVVKLESRKCLNLSLSLYLGMAQVLIMGRRVEPLKATAGGHKTPTQDPKRCPRIYLRPGPWIHGHPLLRPRWSSALVLCPAQTSAAEVVQVRKSLILCHGKLQV